MIHGKRVDFDYGVLSVVYTRHTRKLTGTEICRWKGYLKFKLWALIFFDVVSAGRNASKSQFDVR